MNTRSKVFASYNILQYQCDFIHVLIFVIVSKCQKIPKLTNIVIKVLVALVFFMAIRHVMAVVVILQQLALHQHYGAEKKDCRAEMRVLRHYNTCALPHTPLHSNHELVRNPPS
jgi:hypothetical protein